MTDDQTPPIELRRPPRRGRAGRYLAVAVPLVTATLLASACTSTAATPPRRHHASGQSGAQRATGHRSSNRIGAKELVRLRKEVAQAESVPKFAAPGPKVSAARLKGARALVMPVNSEIDTCQNQAKSYQALGRSLGMKVDRFSNSGSPSQWISGIDDATSARDDVITLLCGIIPGAVAPQLTAAERAGIKVVDGNYNEVKDYRLLDAETAVDVAGGLESDVNDALVNLNGKPLHALLVTSSSIVQGPASIAAVAHQIHADCARQCSLDATVNVQIQDWATQVQSDVSSALQAHKDVNAVFVAFDGMTTFALPAVEQARRPDLRIYAWGGSASVEKLMEQKSPIVAADAGPDEEWDAYAAMDQTIRLLSHAPAAPVTKEVDPNRLWVPSNVSAFFGPKHSYANKGYGGNAFVNGFRKLWGLKPVS